MTPNAIHGDAKHLSLMLLELRHQLLVQDQLVRADRAPIRWIEGQDDRPAGEIRQTDPLVRGRRPENSGASAPTNSGWRCSWLTSEAGIGTPKR